MRSTPVPYGVRDDFGYREGEDVRGFTEEENKLWSNVQSMEEREAVMRQRDERRCGLRRNQLLGPCVGAVKVTTAPGTGFPFWSTTVTARRTGNRDPTDADSPVAAPAVTVCGAAARFRSV